jgi:hypothetical protein
MPPKSKAQQKAAGAALGAKRKGVSLPKGTPSGDMEAMSESQLGDYAATPKANPFGGKKK